MRVRAIGSLLAPLTLALAVPASAQTAPAGKAAPAQPRPAAPAQAPAGKAATAPGQAAPAANPAVNQVLATVNGEKITRGEVVGLLSQYPIPPGSEEQSYKGAINALINLKILQQFLEKQAIKVDAKEVDEQVQKIEAELKQEGGDLPTALAQNGLTVDELRKQITQTLRWKNFVLSRATDAELQKNFQENRDFYDQTQVKASHILVKVEPDSPEAEKAQARQKLEGIKKEIESNQISFADAANKYSEDDGNVRTKAGGDLGFFFRKGQFIEKFAAAAFALKDKMGTISEPVETEYGFHLIKVTDRRDGTEANFEEIKPLVTNEFARELQEQLVEQQRKSAQIDIQPMPADLFPKAPPAPQPVAPAAPRPGAGAPPATKGATPPATKGATPPPAAKNAAPGSPR